MVDTRSAADRFDWRLPFYAVAIAAAVLIPLMVWHADAILLYILLIGPTILLYYLVQLLVAAIRKQPRRCLLLSMTILAFLAVSAALLINEGTLRPALRWLLWSRHLKAEVAQTTPPNGELKHMAWDRWSGTRAGDWTAYVVFDPTESLSAAAASHASGMFSGVWKATGIPFNWK
jgi:hypothetical protein